MRATSSILIDANLLVLFVVGMADRSLISRHKRTRAYTEEDYDLLCRLLTGADEILVTPNILTEASNLVSQTAEPDRGLAMAALAAVIARVSESYVPSSEACARTEFVRLGLADSVILQGTTGVRCVLTADFDLYLALQKERRPVLNFNHIRENGWEGAFPSA